MKKLLKRLILWALDGEFSKPANYVTFSQLQEVMSAIKPVINLEVKTDSCPQETPPGVDIRVPRKVRR